MENKTITSTDLEKFVNTEECEIIVGKKYEKYKHKWWLVWAKKDDTISLSSRASWNWSAFLFPPFWLLYRKMYREFSILLGVQLISIVLMAATAPSDFEEMLYLVSSNEPSSFSTISNIGSIAGLIIMVVVGVYGNVWYLRKSLEVAEENAHRVLASPTLGASASANMDDTQKDEESSFLQKAGDTNSNGVWGYIAASAVVAILPFLGVSLAMGYMANFVLNIAIIWYIYSNFLREQN